MVLALVAFSFRVADISLLEFFHVGRLRKRSRDVRVGEIPTESRRPLLAGTPVREESKDAENSSETSDTRINRLKSAADRILPTTGTLSQMGMEHVQQFEDINEPTQSISGKVEGDHVNKRARAPLTKRRVIPPPVQQRSEVGTKVAEGS